MSETTSKTFKYQKSLPKLPVPPLEDTLNKYLNTLRPILSSSAYAQAEAAVHEFAKPDGQGVELQKRLKNRDESTEKSWLIDWWNDYAYMGYRDPVVVNVNYFFVFKDDKRRRDPASRAASIVKAALEFKRQLINEEIEPDMARTTPLCMHQYRYLFNSTRIPKIPSDDTRVADPRSNNHIIVMRNNEFWVVETEQEGVQLTTAELQSQFNYIIKNSNGNVPAVGALTTENRDVWTHLRTELLNISPANQAAIDKIETAAMVICLDKSKPVTKEESSVACWVGDGKNRFFDKSLQFIVFENGKAGFNGEHSMMDATPTSRLCEFICESLDKGEINHGPAISSRQINYPECLEFKLNANLLSAIDLANQRFNTVVDAHQLSVCSFEAYGKNTIKKLGLSPDAYAQMAIQLAYFKMYGTCRPTYESAQTRKFAYGRTETCRSVSNESVQWVKAMEDPDIPLKAKGDLGRKAIASHTKYMAACVEGLGVDRHLLGLRLLLKPNEPKPAIFTDPSYAYSTHWFLSTSQISSEYYDGYGWGEVVPDGYGIAYMIKENSMQFNIVSLKLRNEQLRQYFHEALFEMRDAFEASAPPLKSKL